MRLHALPSLAALVLLGSPAWAAWSEPANLGSNVNSAADEYGATLSGDGSLLIFDSNRPGGMGRQDLYKSSWDGAAWGVSSSLGANVNTTGVDYAPSLTGDASTLYFTGSDWDLYSAAGIAGVYGGRAKVTQLSTVGSEEWAPGVSYDGATILFTARLRPGGLGGHDIWIAQKVSGVWQAPTNIGAAINTAGDEYAGSLNAAGDHLYFSRAGDLYVSEKVAGVWQTPALLDGLVNSDYYETHPVISADGLTLYFGSERLGGFGGYDIWSSSQLDITATPDPTRTPTSVALILAGPNPMVGQTSLRLALPQNELVDLSVYALSGRRVLALHHGSLSAGYHPFVFDGRDEEGRSLSSGAYLIRAAGQGWSRTQKVVLLH